MIITDIIKMIIYFNALLLVKIPIGFPLGRTQKMTKIKQTSD